MRETLPRAETYVGEPNGTLYVRVAFPRRPAIGFNTAWLRRLGRAGLPTIGDLYPGNPESHKARSTIDRHLSDRDGVECRLLPATMAPVFSERDRAAISTVAV